MFRHTLLAHFHGWEFQSAICRISRRIPCESGNPEKLFQEKKASGPEAVGICRKDSIGDPVITLKTNSILISPEKFSEVLSMNKAIWERKKWNSNKSKMLPIWFIARLTSNWIMDAKRRPNWFPLVPTGSHMLQCGTPFRILNVSLFRNWKGSRTFGDLQMLSLHLPLVGSTGFQLKRKIAVRNSLLENLLKSLLGTL